MNPPRDVIRAGAELVRCSSDAWLTPRDITTPVVVLVHGFTSHGRYLKTLGDYLDGHGFLAVLFNYDSFKGIDVAADELAARLAPLTRLVETFGFALVGHSMGGLVARRFARHCSSDLKNGLRGIATVGTPNTGTLNSRVIDFMLDWADALTLPHPYNRDPACRSARQLMCTDSEAIVATLNAPNVGDPRVPMLSISGGLPFLELGSKTNRFSRTKNAVLQRCIGKEPNDGLVAEESADLRAVTQSPQYNVIHRNDYPDFKGTNHTHLVQNQEVANLLVSWLSSVCFAAL